MSIRPSDRAIAQAFDESKNEWFKTQVDLIRWVIDRANGIDAAIGELDATAAPVVVGEDRFCNDEGHAYMGGKCFNCGDTEPVAPNDDIGIPISAETGNPVSEKNQALATIVTDEMVERALYAEHKGYRLYDVMDCGDVFGEQLVRAALTAALAGD